MEVKVGEHYYHKHMYQRFEVLAIDGDYVWLKSDEHYLTTMITNLEKEKAPLPLPNNGVK